MTRQYWANLVFCLILGALVIFFVTQVSSALTPKGLFVNESEPSLEAMKMFKDVVLTKYQIGESEKNMVEANFYIQNNSNQSVKNLNILCEFFDENGMYRDQKTWKLAETIPAMHQVKISSVSKRFVNTGARALNCSITDLQLLKKPFFTLERQASGGHGQATETAHGEKPSSGH